MTYRERQEAKAARLSEWADKRTAKAAAGFAAGSQYAGDTAFWTQPGRIPERERMYRAHERASEDAKKAETMNGRAEGIECQLAGAIYSDDANAIEALTARIATLETEREFIKAFNAAARKGVPLADFEASIGRELKDRTRANYEDLSSRRATMPAFALTNLSADIRRNKQRLEGLQKAATGSQALRLVYARREGACERCEQPIVLGSVIGKYTDGWSHVTVQDDHSQVRCTPA